MKTCSQVARQNVFLLYAYRDRLSLVWRKVTPTIPCCVRYSPHRMNSSPHLDSLLTRWMNNTASCQDCCINTAIGRYCW